MQSRTSPSRLSSIRRRTSKHRSRPRKRAASFVQLLYSSMIPAYLALGWQKTPKRSFSPCPRFWRTTGQIPFLPKLISCATSAKIMNVQSACSRRGRDDLFHLVRAVAHALRDIIKNTPLYVHKYPTLCTQVPHFMYINTPLCAHKHPTLCIYPYGESATSPWRGSPVCVFVCVKVCKPLAQPSPFMV